MGAGRAPGLGHGDAGPVRREQDQRRGRPPRDHPQADPARPQRDRARAGSRTGRPLPHRRRARRTRAHRPGRGDRGGLPPGRRVRRRRRGRPPAPSPSRDRLVEAPPRRRPRPHRARGRARHPDRRTTMPTERFPSPFDIATPEGAEGWESMYDWYHLFGPERRELDEQRFWFADRLHHPDVLHPYDEIQCECWWQALGAFNTRIFAMPPAYGVDQRILNGRLYVTPGPRAAGATSPAAPRSSASARATTTSAGTRSTPSGRTRCSPGWRRSGAALRPAARPRAGVDGLRARRDVRGLPDDPRLRPASSRRCTRPTSSTSSCSTSATPRT